MASNFNAKIFLENGGLLISDLNALELKNLREVADELRIEISDEVNKSELVEFIAGHLGIFDVNTEYTDRSNVTEAIELARIEANREKLRLELELEKRRMEMDFELRKIQIQASADTQNVSSVHITSNSFDISKNFRFVPKFDDDDLDSYFLSFERIASRMKWPKEYWTLLLQSMFTGQAREVYASLSTEQSEDYNVVKKSILAAYELVPEAYRQKFKALKKRPSQSHVEFAREKQNMFDKWYRSLGLEKTYEKMRELFILDEYKECIAIEVRTHLNEKKIYDLSKAAIVSDEYEINHKSSSDRSKMGLNLSKHGNFGNTNDLNERRPTLKCYHCGKPGHLKSNCFALKNEDGQKASKPVGLIGDVYGERRNMFDGYEPFKSRGEITFSKQMPKPKEVIMLRDTGAALTLMLSSVIPSHLETTNEKALIQGIDGDHFSVPLYKIYLKSQLFTGNANVGIVETLPMKGVHLILGNDLCGDRIFANPVTLSTPVENKDTEQLEMDFPGIFPACVTTRAQTSLQKQDDDVSELVVNKDVWLSETFFHNLEETDSKSVPESEKIYSRSTLVENQKKDTEISNLRNTAVTEEESSKLPNCYYIKNDILFRKWRPLDKPANEEWAVKNQIVLPPCYRQEILRLSHEIPMSGHLGVRKTQARVMNHFFWPNLHRDITAYCKTCHTCQIIGKAQHSIKPAPLIPIPAFEEPFSRIIIDCVGPLPRTKSGFRFLLTIMDTSTRFPEAIPLKRITSKVVVEALTIFFTRFGLPRELQSDQGSNFLSGIFQEVVRQLGIHQLTSTAYHPQSQGALERYHQTLKTMLRAYCNEYPEDWDKGIAFVLFATRDTPNESTGFTPFELVYGHEVRGPLKLVKEKFIEDDDKTQNLLDYVCTFRERLTKACQIAAEHLNHSQAAMKIQYDKKAEKRNFLPGEKVLLLLPLPSDPLSAKFNGPYIIEKKLSEVNYIVRTPDRRKKRRVCHINMLKKYFERGPHMESVKPIGIAQTVQEDEDIEDEDIEDIPRINNAEVIGVKLSNSDIVANLDLQLKHLQPSQISDLSALIRNYPDICADSPGCTTLVEHDVDIGENHPIKLHPYRLNPSKLEIVRTEIDSMLAMGVIEKSYSSFSSPIVLIPKPDGSNRLCIDYRKVNAITVTDSFPIPRIEDCIDKVGRATYVTKIDLEKAYWQVPLTERAKEVSAFATPDGLYQCRVMPFGMKNAPATFQRLINQVISGMSNCAAYLDDVVVYNDTWEEHLITLTELFNRLNNANLVLNLKKSEFAQAKVVYLGHEVGQGTVMPRQAKIQAIIEFPAPRSKRELLRFLGMSGFYRKFCANYSTIVAPLTNLLKKSEKFYWYDNCQTAFDKLKAILTNEPVLAAPNFLKPFKIAIDASDIGIGGVLLQDNEIEIDCPVSYYSKKLNRHQRQYSTIEKETLALVLTIQHFEIYVTNSHGDVIVYTDHNPLVFLEKFKNKSQRLFRWSLLLQPYSLKIIHIPGKENVIADALSRT